MRIGSNLFDASPGREINHFPAHFNSMNPDRQFLCSHLITIEQDGCRTTVNLERIWAGGATVNAEEPIAPGTELLLPDLGATARVVFTDADEAGHFCDLEFSPSYRWSLDKFRPQHLTDPSLLA